MQKITDEKNLFLEGKYVFLESVSPKHFPHIVGWRNSERVSRYVIQPFRLTEELEAKWYEKYRREKGHCMLVLTAKKQNVPFGTLGYIRYNAAQKICIGTHHLVGEEAYRGSKEYAEAALLFHDHLFQTLGVEKCYVHVIVENTKTVNLLKKIGFQDSSPARFPECLQMGGKTLLEYVLTAQSYAEHRHLLLQLVDGMEDS